MRDFPANLSKFVMQFCFFYGKLLKLAKLRLRKIVLRGLSQ